MSTTSRVGSTFSRTCLLWLIASAVVAGHAGPPYPILSDRIAGAYTLSIWTDPDATDDKSRGGQFWVVIDARGGGEVPAGTRATLTVRALDRADEGQIVTAEPVRGDAGNQFASVVMDHEGPYHVAVAVTGPLGDTSVASRADATYDLRPPPYMLAWYLLPFIFAGLLWGRLLMRRRRRAS